MDEQVKQAVQSKKQARMLVVCRPNSSGFSLMEALVAVFFLSIMSVSLAELLLSGIYFNSIANDEVHLNAIATDRMEQLKNMSFDQLGMPCLNSSSNCGSLASNITDTSVTPNVAYFDESDPQYVVRWTVSILSGDINFRRTTVRVISLKMTRAGRQRELILYYDRTRF